MIDAFITEIHARFGDTREAAYTIHAHGGNMDAHCTVAARAGHISMVRELMMLGARATTATWTAAIESGSIDVVRTLKEESRNYYSFSRIERNALAHGQTEIASWAHMEAHRERD